MKSNHSSLSILVLGGYGTVGSVVVDDLLESGYSVTVAGRNSRSIDQLLESKNHPLLTGKVVDVQDCSSLRNACSGHDIVLSCLDYSLNATVISTCADLGIHYVDLGDNYDGILHSHTYNAIFSNNKKLACLGAGSAPGIINVLVAYLARDKEQVHNLTISFADVLYKKPENMLPFNFMTVTEEILDPALVFRDGEHRFIPGMSESQSINFGDTFGTHTVYATNHDETYSLPKFLWNKGLKEATFLMQHDSVFLDLVPRLKQFGFLDTRPVHLNGMAIRPRDFSAEIMRRFLPRNFQSDDTEMLYARLDDDTITAVNRSVNGVPAGIMNTGIGASLIVQYIVTHQDTIPHGTQHPESIVEPEWMIRELKKRWFDIRINGEEIR